LAGKKTREIRFPGGVGWTLRPATFGDDGAKAPLTFSHWLGELNAYDFSGKPLWSYPRASGIDDVWAGDLDGDGWDEGIVGYNGDTGIEIR
jgi:hypothetical protein